MLAFSSEHSCNLRRREFGLDEKNSSQVAHTVVTYVYVGDCGLVVSLHFIEDRFVFTYSKEK